MLNKNNLKSILQFNVLLLSLLLIIGCFGCSQPDQEFPIIRESKVKWRNFHNGLQEASKTNKLIFLDIYADWCYPCKEMDHQVFQDSLVAELLQKSFIPVRIDYDSKTPLPCGGKLKDAKICLDEDWSTQEQIKALPFIAFLNHKGERIFSRPGKLSTSEFILLLQELKISHEDS